MLLFAYRNYTCNVNATLFENGGHILLSQLTHKGTRGQLSPNYYLPHVRTSTRKNSVVRRSIIVWNALPVDFKNVDSVSMFKNLLFTKYMNQY